MSNLIFFNRNETLLDTQVLVTGPSATVWATPYYMALPALLAGDLIHVTAEQEIRCDVSYNTEMVSEVIMGPNWCPNNTDLPVGFNLCAPMGTDASNSPIHYWNAVRTSQFRMPYDYPATTVQFRIRCRSTAASGNDYNSFISNGYGHLDISVWR